MTLQEFDIRMIQEEKRFLGMCLEAGIWDTVADRVLPTRARAFAEALSLDLSVEATRARIQADQQEQQPSAKWFRRRSTTVKIESF